MPMMAASRFAGPARCTACQRFVLEQLTGISLRRQPLHGYPKSPRPFPARRNIHAAVSERVNASVPQSDDESQVRRSPLEDVNESSTEATAEGQSSPNDKQPPSTTPWYLRNNEPSSDSNPFAHRQRLPALPKDPPPILEALLKHLSVDIGLDYLNLLDLRQVDPPPAFGANLFMVFGTARSEKHLNVSADRLCRWLRSEYKLTPYADGLLGRQELKLKLRRKARRTKMLSAAGASNASSLQLDDGTRTGWVCVSVGDVEPSANAADQDEVDKDFVGFGSQSNTAKIVIQMLVEEKRVELDLETLWQGILKGSIRRQRESDSDTMLAPVSQSTEYNTQDQGFGSFATRQQIRAFHTNARARYANESSALDGANGNGLASGDWAKTAASRLNITNSDLVADLIQLSDLLLRASVRDVLGAGEHDTSSTSFLRHFFSKMPPFRLLDHWNAHLVLHRLGISAGHEGYTSEHQWTLLQNMEDSCMGIPAETFMFVSESVMLQKSASIASVSIKDYRAVTAQSHNLKHLQRYSPQFTAVEKHLHMAFDALERMESQGHARLPLNFFLSLHAGISQRLESRFSNRERSELQLRYYKSLKLIFPTDEPLPQVLVLDMLRTWARQESWRNFYALWRDIALTGFRRDKDMYNILFDAIGTEGDQANSRRAIAEWVPEMQKEKPAVEIDDKIALGILRCLSNLGFRPQEDQGLVKIYGNLWDKCWAVVGPQH